MNNDRRGGSYRSTNELGLKVKGMVESLIEHHGIELEFAAPGPVWCSSEILICPTYLHRPSRFLIWLWFSSCVRGSSCYTKGIEWWTWSFAPDFQVTQVFIWIWNSLALISCLISPPYHVWSCCTIPSQKERIRRALYPFLSSCMDGSLESNT